MSYIEFAKKAGRGLALSAALLGGVSLAAVPAAQARDWHGGGGGNWGGGGWRHGGGGWGGGGWRHGGGGWGAAVGFGLLGGALAGAAIANSPYYGYGYPSYGYGYPSYGYSYPSYSYGYGYPSSSYGYGYPSSSYGYAPYGYYSGY